MDKILSAEEFLREVCPNHTDASKWNKSELLAILNKQGAYLLDAFAGEVKSEAKIKVVLDNYGFAIDYEIETEGIDQLLTKFKEKL